jgi:phage-related protein
MTQGSLFRWDFSIQSGYTAESRSLQVAFGDGYEQEMPDGLTGPDINWRIIVANIDLHEAMELEGYLKWHMRTGTRIQVRHPDTADLLTASVKKFRYIGTSGPLRTISIDAREVQEWP